MQLFDTHCHLDVEEFDADRQAVLARTKAVGVAYQLVPAVKAATWEHLINFCASDTGLYPALGMHPVYLEEHTTEHLQQLERRIAEARPVAVGEIGLDYFVEELDRQRQQELFEAQLVIAREAKLPVILHVRKAHDQMLQTLKRFKVIGGIAHAFNGSLQQAQQYIDLGFKLGFGGMMTYERSSKIRKLAKELPLQAIVLETDAPDMTVASHRGERNSPEYLPECLAALSALRDASPDLLAEQTTRNAFTALGLPHE